MLKPPVYKVNHMKNENTIASIHVFFGPHKKQMNLDKLFKTDPTNEVFNFFRQEELDTIQKNNIPVVFSKQQIHSDDSISTVKIKIANEFSNTFSLEEIYLFSMKEETLHSSNIYQILTQNGKLELTKLRMAQFLSNLIRTEDASHFKIDLPDKTTYDYSDILELKLNGKKMWVNQVLGQKLFIVENEYPFVVNPFDVKLYDEFIERAARKSLTTLNSHLLLNTGEIIGNNIYLCLAEDVLRSAIDKGIPESYTIKLYYPFLFKKGPTPVLSLEDINKHRETWIEENKKTIITPNVLDTIQNVDLFYDIYNQRTENFKYHTKGIKSVHLVLHPIYKLKVPLEIIFKILHATEETPLIKYNPSVRQENIYRLYTEKTALDGRKIPFLSKSTILKLKTTIAKTKSVAVYMEIPGKNESFVCEFEENGNIGIHCDFMELMTQEKIEALIKEFLNPVITEVKNYLEQSGYSVELFESLDNPNVEIRQLNYECSIEISKPIKIDKIQGCLSSIFVVESSNFKKGIDMRFKRVANFNKTTSQEAFIIEKQKQGVFGIDLLNELMKNYKMTEGDARELLSKMANELQVELGVKKNPIEIKINPGFKTSIRLNAEKGEITITVENINDIAYLNTIPIYLDSFIRLTQNKSSTSVSSKHINTLCSKDELKEPVMKDIISFGEESMEKQEDEPEKNIDIGVEEDEDDDEEKPKNALDLLYGDDFEEFEEFDDMEGGKGEDEDDDKNEYVASSGEASEYESEEGEDLFNEVKNIDGKSLTNPNPFFAKMRKLDSVLFLTKDQGKKFKRYSRTCPSNARRQPVILTKEELDKINEEQPGFLKKEDVISYGSDKNKQFYYTCPRYWCMKTNRPINPAEIVETIGPDGEKVKSHPTCGNVIPRNKGEIPPGAYIYEFFDPSEHGTQDKYIQHYPGFVKDGKHPDGLCIPCCFKKWNGPAQLKRKKQCEASSLLREETTRENQVEDQKEKKPVASPIERKTTDKTDYVVGPEKFPLEEGRWGYLPGALEIFLKNINANCQISKNNQNIKPFHTCLLRHGVETDENQSFIACIADTRYFGKAEKIPSVREMKEIILSAVDIDQFITYQNGNLFANFSTDKQHDTSKYENSKIFKKLNTKEATAETRAFLNKLVGSFENFCDFLRDDSVLIDYTYLWDIICRPNPKLFVQGVNLVIMELVNNDITNNIEIICPSNHYSNEIYDPRKQTLLLFKSDNYFEPIYAYRNEETHTKVSTAFSEFDRTLSPELRELFQKIIKPILRNTCLPLSSMPNEYKFARPIMLQNLIEILNANDYKIISQLINLQSKVIGLVVSKNETRGFIPCYPSALDNSYDSVFMMDDFEKFFTTYRDTVKILTTLHQESKGVVPCRPAFKVVEDEVVVGLLTDSNQFIQITDPTPVTEINDDIKTLTGENYLVADNKTLISQEVDVERVDYIQKIKLETNFFNIFRNTIRILLNNYENRSLREKIEKETNLNYELYTDKLSNITRYLRDLVDNNDAIVFVDDYDYKKVKEISTCMVLPKDKCEDSSKKPLCFYNDANHCQLVLPKKNLISGSNNELFYFSKMADELIRYSRIKTFIFKPYVYLSFGNVDYNLRNNEIILLQSLLTQEYFDNLVPAIMNQYVRNNTRDEAEPLKSQVYDNIVKISEGTVDETLCSESKHPISSSLWKGCFPNNYVEVAYEGSDSCGFTMLSNIIEKKIQKTLSVNELRVELYREYLKYLDKYHGQIIDILIMEGKRTLGNQVKSNSITFQNMIFTENYYITNLDVWILMKKYKIPSVLISSKEIMQTNYTSSAFVLFHGEEPNEAMCFIFTTTNRFKIVVPKYKLIMNNTGEIFNVPTPSCQEKITTAIEKSVDLEEYFSSFSAVELNKLKKKVKDDDSKPKPIPKKKKLVLKQDDADVVAPEKPEVVEVVELKEKQQKTVVLKNKTRKLKPKLKIVESTP